MKKSRHAMYFAKITPCVDSTQLAHEYLWWLSIRLKLKIMDSVQISSNKCRIIYSKSAHSTVMPQILFETTHSISSIT